ncbi:hypothetical protein [Bradyrhizobium tunisiense]|uniref:hypothetical protein n=1 Tax=Bradyrhizobium tunisiense TaxID=3278709 RepID=UPI0035D92F72
MSQLLTIDAQHTRNAIRRDRLEIDAGSLAFCAHDWSNSGGYLELVRKFPLMLAL